MSDFLKEIIKETGNEYATLAKDGVAGGDIDSFIDTGSYSFNVLNRQCLQITSVYGLTNNTPCSPRPILYRVSFGLNTVFL